MVKFKLTDFTVNAGVPSWASYGVSVVRILEKIYCILTALHCAWSILIMTTQILINLLMTCWIAAIISWYGIIYQYCHIRCQDVGHRFDSYIYMYIYNMMCVSLQNDSLFFSHLWLVWLTMHKIQVQISQIKCTSIRVILLICLIWNSWFWLSCVFIYILELGLIQIKCNFWARFGLRSSVVSELVPDLMWPSFSTPVHRCDGTYMSQGNLD